MFFHWRRTLACFASELSSFDINFQVQLRTNVSVQMGATVAVNPRNPSSGLQVLFLNGTGQTANTFKPLTQAIFSDNFVLCFEGNTF